MYLSALSFILGVVATVFYFLQTPVRASIERKWYILSGNEWIEYQKSYEVNQCYSIYLRTQQSIFKRGNRVYVFESSHTLWKLWVVHGSERNKLMYKE